MQCRINMQLTPNWVIFADWMANEKVLDVTVLQKSKNWMFSHKNPRDEMPDPDIKYWVTYM